MTRILLRLLALLALAGPLFAAAAPAAAPDPVARAGAAAGTDSRTAVIFNRPIVTFRTNFLGASPADRADATQFRVRYLLAKGGPGVVDTETLPQGVAIRIDGALAFVITAGDVNAVAGETLDQAVQSTERALTQVIDETRESRDLHRLGLGLLRAAIATLVAGVAVWALVRLRRLAKRALLDLTRRHADRLRVGGAELVRAERVAWWGGRAFTAIFWAAALLIGYEWLGYVLSQFPYTRPWGEQLTLLLFDAFVTVAGGIARALPDIAIAVFIFIVARWVTKGLAGFFDRVESAQVRVDWLDAELARPTRRIASVVIWVFALVMAYPYLPGAQTDAFKGISVLAGVMISLGGASVIGQAFSGLILMYTRTVHVGEYVRIADHEGTVVELTLYMTRVRTGLGEELSIPNSLVLSSVVRNYSRAVKGRGYIVDTTVTIGYDTPWRQVHAMLVEAARRTPGVLADPAPHVFQTGLADFYPEYRLVCQAVPDAPRPRAEVMNALHQSIQDVFNEYGVQIMSPHYLGDPVEAKVVPPAKWRPAPAHAHDEVPARTG
jgi:small-conductance mechanosensitive channel